MPGPSTAKPGGAAPSPSPSPSPTLARRLAAGSIMTVLMPVLVAVGFGLTEGLGFRIAAFVIPVLIGGAVCAGVTGAAEGDSPDITGPFLVGFVLAAWPGTQAGVALHQHWAGHAGPISVAEVPAHADAGTYEFDDARLLWAQRGVVVSTSIQGDPDDESSQEVMEHVYVVAPLVAASWTEGEAIPAWLIVSDTGPTEVGERLEAVRVRGRSEHRGARDQAIATHGLVEAEDAPILDPRQPGPDDLGERLRRFAAIFAVGVLLWLGLTVFVARRAR